MPKKSPVSSRIQNPKGYAWAAKALGVVLVLIPILVLILILVLVSVVIPDFGKQALFQSFPKALPEVKAALSHPPHQEAGKSYFQ